MSFLLVVDSEAPPEFPHIICAGRAGDCAGRGWAWHEDDSRRACFAQTKPIVAGSELVSNAIDGRNLPGIDRILAIAELRKQTSEQVIRRLFHETCPACGANHLERAIRALRAAKFIHPLAIHALRKARVPEDRLTRCHNPRERLSDPDDAKKARALARRARFVPFIPGDSSATKIAQIAYAVRYR